MKSEFMQVINLVSPNNTLEQEKNGKRRNHYHSWIIDGFYLGLVCGGRTEEPTQMKWSDIKLTSDGDMYLIDIIDLKRTRALDNRGNDEIIIRKTVEVTPELEQLLREMGFEEKRGSHEFVLAPDEDKSRSRIAQIISNSFNFYIKQLDLPQNKLFKHLRKTYAIDCRIKDPKNFYKKLGHTNPNTTMKHYVDMDTVLEYRRLKLSEKLKRKVNVEDVKSTYRNKRDK